MKLNKGLVLVRVDSALDKDESGVWIQEEWKDAPPTGVVEAVAPDVTFCKVGDKVHFERYTSIKTPNKDLRLCREDAIFEVY